MRLRLLAICPILIFCLAGVILADPPMTTIRIEVKTYSDKPIDRASVIVKFVQGRDYVKLGKKVHTSWQMKTNQEGMAKIPAIPQGKLLVQVIAKGYQTFGQTFEVNEAERTIEVKLNAPQPQVSAHQ